MSFFPTLLIAFAGALVLSGLIAFMTCPRIPFFLQATLAFSLAGASLYLTISNI